jgi:hypothetical protein
MAEKKRVFVGVDGPIDVKDYFRNMNDWRSKDLLAKVDPK